MFLFVKRGNVAKNAFFPHPSDRVDIRVVVLMDGKIVEPSKTELSSQISFQGTEVTIDKKDRETGAVGGTSRQSTNEK